MNSEMETSCKSKPINETKSDERLDVRPSSNKNDEKEEFSTFKHELESELVKNEVAEAKLYFGVISDSKEHSDSSDQEKQITMNKSKTENKTDGSHLHVNEYGEKVLEVEKDFMQQTNTQDFVLKDGCYTSRIGTNSSGIGNNLGVPENCATENEGETNDNKFEYSPIKQFLDVKNFDFPKDPSGRKEIKNKDDDLYLDVNENEKKEVLVMENDFIQQIDTHKDVSRDGNCASNIETNSSGIWNGFEAPENCATEDKGEINHKIFEYSSAKQFPDVELSIFTEDPSSKREIEDNNNDLQMNENEENDFMREVVSRDGSYASSIESSSSGIGTDFEHEDSATENEVEINDNMIENSSSEQFLEVENSNFAKDILSKKDNASSENSDFEGKEQENINLISNEDNVSKENKDASSPFNSASLFNSITFPYMNPANCFDVVVPLIGNDVIAVGDIELCTYQADVAREINRLKAIEDAPYMPKISYHEWKKQRDARPQEEKDREERNEKFTAVKIAVYFIKTATYILNEMQKDNPNEGKMERCFIRFLRAPISTLSLLLSTPFIHVMMYIRGSSDFSSRLRYIADKCYLRCHVMFPIPDGYNFVTVYSSEVVKNIPEQLDGMRNYILDYGNFEDPDSEGEDSAFSDNYED